MSNTISKTRINAPLPSNGLDKKNETLLNTPSKQTLSNNTTCKKNKEKPQRFLNQKNILERFIKEIEDAIKEGNYNLAIDLYTLIKPSIQQKATNKPKINNTQPDKPLSNRLLDAYEQIINPKIENSESFTLAYLNLLVELAIFFKMYGAHFPKPLYFEGLSEQIFQKHQHKTPNILAPREDLGIWNRIKYYFRKTESLFFKPQQTILENLAFKLAGIGMLISSPINLMIIEQRIAINKFVKQTYNLKYRVAEIINSFHERNGLVIDNRIKSLFHREDKKNIEIAILKEPSNFTSLILLTKLLKHGFQIPIIVQEEEVVKNGNNIVNIAINGTIESEDELTLLKAGSSRTNANFILPLTDSIKFIEQGGNKIATVSSGLMFKEDKPVFVKFNTPLPLHYIVNYADDNLDKRIKEYGIPTAQATLAEEYINEKDISTTILARNGINVPKTISIIGHNSDHHFINKHRTNSSNCYFVNINEPEKSRETVKQIIDNFITSNNLNTPFQLIVVKANNLSGGRGVEFFYWPDIRFMTSSTIRLLESGNNVVIQERILPPLMAQKNNSEDSSTEKRVQYDWNLRVFVSNIPGKGPVVSDILVRIAKYGTPVNICQGAQCDLLESIALESNISNDMLIHLQNDIADISKRAYLAIKESMIKDKNIKPNEDISDFMGIDIIVKQEQDKLVPYIIELNDFHSGGMWDFDNYIDSMDEAVYRERKGKPCKDWIETMLTKAQQYKSTILQQSS